MAIGGVAANSATTGGGGILGACAAAAVAGTGSSCGTATSGGAFGAKSSKGETEKPSGASNAGADDDCILDWAFEPNNRKRARRMNSGLSAMDHNEDKRTCNSLSEKINRLENDLRQVGSVLPQDQGFKAGFYRHMRTVRRSCLQCGSPRWIASSAANMLFGSVIVVNAIYLGLETDLKDNDDSLSVDTAAWLPWFFAESVFLTIFTVEIMLRVRADGAQALRDPWNLFDLVMVTLGILDSWVLQFALRGAESDELSLVMIFRLGRLVRLARVLRILRLFRFLRELTLLAQGIIGAVRTLGWSFFLIAMVLYMSAVFATTVYGESGNVDIETWFGSLGSSLLTLFQLMTLEDWPQVARGVMAVPALSQSWLFFIPFIGLTNFVLLNVITGVVVERVLYTASGHSITDVNKADEQKLQSMVELREIFDLMEPTQTGYLTKEQFERGLESKNVMDRFTTLGFMKYEVEHLFAYVQVHPKHPVQTLDLVEGCLRLSGPAQSKHLLWVQYDILRFGRHNKEEIKTLTKQVRWLANRLEQQEAHEHPPFGGAFGGRKSTCDVGNRCRRSMRGMRTPHKSSSAESSSLSSFPGKLALASGGGAGGIAAAAAAGAGAGGGTTAEGRSSSTSAQGLADASFCCPVASGEPTSAKTASIGGGEVEVASMSAAATASAASASLPLQAIPAAVAQEPELSRQCSSLSSSSSPKEAGPPASPLKPLLRRIDELVKEQAATRALVQAYADEVRDLRTAAAELLEPVGKQPNSGSASQGSSFLVIPNADQALAENRASIGSSLPCS